MNKDAMQQAAVYLPLLLSWTFVTICAQDVRLPPFIAQQPSEKVIVYRYDDSRTLGCVAAGTPTPEYEWLKNGATLDLNLPNIQPNPESGTITIDPLGSLDEGYYQCVASNLYGKALSNVVFLQRAVLTPYLPQDNPTVYDAVEGEAAMIHCESTTSVPSPTYTWSVITSGSDLNPKDLMLDGRVNTDTNGDLHFANTLLSDNMDDKIYQCSVFNPFLVTTVHGSYSRINVAPFRGGNIRPSRVFSTATPTIALVATDMVLKCLFAGKPTPRISWRRKKSSLPIGRHNIRNYDAELVISHVEYSDEDTYYCKGTNFAGNDEVAIAVDVQKEPVFVDDEASVSNMYIDEGETAVFRCDTNAEPIADTTWFKNGEPLKVQENPRMMLSENDRTLTIRDVCKACPGGSSDLMTLQCNASNVHGYVFSSRFLNVLACSLTNGGCDAHCVPDGEGTRCECDVGYHLDGDGFTCFDIDECVPNEGKGDCGHQCDNTPGSYQCRCDSGYTLNGDQKSCDDCRDAYRRQLDASQAFTSLCPSIETYLNVPLTTCLIHACADKATVVTYRNSVCSVKLCVGSNLRLDPTSGSSGWDIYVLNTTWTEPRPEDPSSFPLWQLLTGVFVGAAALGAVIAVVTVCIRKRIASGEGEGRTPYENAETITRHETTAENTRTPSEGHIYDEIFIPDVQTTRDPNDVTRHDTTVENTGTQPEGHVYDDTVTTDVQTTRRPNDVIVYNNTDFHDDGPYQELGPTDQRTSTAYQGIDWGFYIDNEGLTGGQ